MLGGLLEGLEQGTESGVQPVNSDSRTVFCGGLCGILEGDRGMNKAQCLPSRSPSGSEYGEKGPSKMKSSHLPTLFKLLIFPAHKSSILQPTFFQKLLYLPSNSSLPPNPSELFSSPSNISSLFSPFSQPIDRGRESRTHKWLSSNGRGKFFFPNSGK